MNETAVEVLKWTGIVFAAGFVGYFGRHLAVVLIEKLRGRKGGSVPPAHPQGTAVGEVPAQPPSSPADAAASATAAKIEKKRAKAEVKRGKKSRPAE